jgi:CysZ protein
MGVKLMHYLMKGLNLIRVKGLKRYVVVPLCINLVLFALAFGYLFSQLGGWVDQVVATLPDWLSFIGFLVWPLALFSIVMGLALTFTMVANFIAAPFNALLAEKTELYLTGQPLPDQGLAAFLKDVPRMLGREWQKFVYCLPRAIGFLLLFFILPGIGQLLWFLFCSWMLAIQYCDYPFDNHKVPFTTMRKALKLQWKHSYAFGISVYVLSLVPLINLLIMPVAVCGATAMWVDKFREALRLPE